MRAASCDGGYYLLGLKWPHRHLFEDVAWSTDLVATQTLERAAEIGLAVEVLPKWYDVDDAASLRMLCAELRDRRPAPTGLQRYTAAHSARLMRVLLAATDLGSRIAWTDDTAIRRAAE
jgi:hypothetical protein